MVNWSDIVSGQTAGTFATIDGTTYGYRNDIQVNEARGVNIVGNPTRFFSNNAFQANIADGRTRNALRVFIYNALRAESDYTDAQAAAWGSATADEVLFTKQNVTGVAGFTAWPVHSGAGGSQTNSTSASNRQLNFICIRDRNGHARAWRIKSSISGSAFNAFSTSYDKLTEAQIRTEFGLPAAATPLTYSNQTQSIAQGASGAALPAATGGTAPYNYALGTAGSTGGTPATSWGPWTTQGTAYPRTTTNATNNTLFRDDATNKVHALIRESNGVFKIYELNLTTGRVSNPVTLSGVPGGDFFVWGADATPDGTWYICGTPLGTQRSNTVYKVNKTTGACTSIGTTNNLLAPTLVAVSNSELLLVTVNASRLHQTPLTLNAARTSFTAGTAISSGTLPSNTVISGIDLYNNRLFIMETGYFGWVQAKTANAAYTSLGTNVPGVPRSLVFDGRDMYSLQQASTRTNAQLYKKTATSGSDAGTGFSTTLPTGITFNATSRVISVGSAVTAGAKALKIRVRDSSSPVKELVRDVALTVTASTTTPTAVAGTLRIAAKTVNLSSSASGTTTIEAASGGTGTVGYALSVNGGTSCTLSGRTLTIPAGQAAGTFRLAVTATWTSGSSTATTTAFFNLTINRTQAPARGTFSPSAKSFSTTSSGSGSVTIDAASGGTGTITYQLRRPHATGLSLSGRTLSIASNTPAGAHTVTIRAYWTTAGGSLYVQSSFTLTVTRSQAPVAGTFNPGNQSASLTHNGSGTATVNAATGGTGTISYALVDAGGTSVTLSGRTLTIPATQAAGNYRLAVRARWTTTEGSRDSTMYFTLSITRSARPASAGTFSQGNLTSSLTHNGSGTQTINAATGGFGTISYALRGTVPTGITLSGRTLSIASNTPAGAHSLTVRATWTAGSSTAFRDASFTLTVSRSARPAVAGTLSISNKTVRLTWNGAGVTTLEAATGGTGTVSYSLMSPPAGLTLTGRVLGIAGSVAAGVVRGIRVRATWTLGSSTATAEDTFDLSINTHS